MPIADCHIHIFDAAGFPFPEHASFRPGPEIGPRIGFAEVAARHGVTNALVINAFREFDHSQMIDVLRWGKGALKGIATLDVDSSAEQIKALKSEGAVGQRFELAIIDLDRLKASAGRRFLASLRDQGWLAELQLNAKSSPSQLDTLLAILNEFDLPIVVGHYSQPDVTAGFEQPVFARIMQLAADGRTVVKISSFFRHTRVGLPYADLDSFIQLVLKDFGPDRVAWGSDWPFTRFPGHVTYAEELACITRWLPRDADRQKVLWETAKKTFGFDEAAVLPA